MTIWLSLKSHWGFCYALNQGWILLLHNPILILIIILPLFIHAVINHPHKSQNLSQLRSFLYSASHLYMVASYVDFYIFSKITSSSLSCLCLISSTYHPEANQIQTGFSLSLLSSQFYPRAQLKAILDLMRLYYRLI